MIPLSFGFATVRPLFNSMILFATFRLSELIVLVSPLTTKLPDIVKLTAVAVPVSAGEARGA